MNIAHVDVSQRLQGHIVTFLWKASIWALLFLENQ